MAEKTKILIVSDDTDLLRLLYGYFNPVDYQLSNVRRTDSSLKRKVQESFSDLILLDIVMPNMNGIATCLRLRSWTHVPIFMLTVWGTDKGEFRRLRLSSDDYLSEPYKIEDLPIQIKIMLLRNFTARVR